MDSTLSSKSILFIAFQTDQNKRNRHTCHIALRFLPTKDPLHPKRVSFTKEGNTQDTPNNEKNNIHTSLVFSQWRRRWSIDSLNVWQKKHLLAKAQPSSEFGPRLGTFPTKPSWLLLKMCYFIACN